MEKGQDATEILEHLEDKLQKVIKFRRETRRLEKVKIKFTLFAQRLGMDELKIKGVWDQLVNGDENGFSRLLMPRLNSNEEEEFKKIKAEITSRSDR